MKKVLGFMFLIVVFTLSACSLPGQTVSSDEVPPTITATPVQPAATFTPIPTLTLTPTITPIPGTIVLDFAAQLCNAKWMNGGQKFASCPDVNSDHSAGYATLLDPLTEGLPEGTPVILTIPAWNGFAALFLRYPALTVQTGDHFRATLQCQSSVTNCDVEFALEYYDANGKYHSPFASWQYHAGQAPINADHDLSALAGQNVDFVLALRPNNDTPQQDLTLWIAPQVFRPAK